tara:strand:+ start:172 stop:813 length:642 start_codon:yes stop_codon:yes gene_type:complete
MIKNRVSDYYRSIPYEEIILVICDTCDVPFIYNKIAKVAGTSIFRKFLQPKYKKTIFYKGHPEEYKQWMCTLTDEKFQKYFKFGFVRNPWDKMVSSYFYFKSLGQINCKFEDYVLKDIYKTANRTVQVHNLPQHIVFFYENENLYDFIGKYEDLEQGFKFICEKLKIEKGINLPMSNKSKGREKGYTQYYTQKTKEKVEFDFKIDIELFDYKF